MIESEEKRRAIIRVDYGDLRRALRLPDNVRIVAIRDEDINETMSIRVEGEGLPRACITQPGCCIPIIVPSYVTHYSTVERVEFGGWK